MSIRLLLLIALLLGLSGCANFPLNSQTPSIQQLDTWLDNHQYGRVIAAVRSVPQSHPEYVHYSARRSAAESRAVRYENSVLSDVASAEGKGDSHTALSLIDKALDNYPESQKLSTKRTALLAMQERKSRVLSAEALLARATWLENELPILEQRAKHSPVDIRLQWTLGQTQNEITSMVSQLITAATDLFEFSEVGLINRCLKQARNFKPGKNDLKTISLLEDRLVMRQADIKRKRLASMARDSSLHNTKLDKEKMKRLALLLKETNRAIKQNNLILARKNIIELNDIAADNTEVIRLDAYIYARINTLVKEMSEQGSMLYRQEQIEPAKKVWEQALTLDPDNIQLKENIQRASRVLEKLKKLREQQTPG